MAVIGYARVSTQDQDFAGQVEKLKAAGAERIYSEKISGARANRPQLAKLMAADSDEAGHAFQIEAGHPFRFEAGHRSDLKSATWQHSGGSRRCCSCFSTWVKRGKHGAERAGSSGTARGRPGSQQEGPARDAACPCS